MDRWMEMEMERMIEWKKRTNANGDWLVFLSLLSLAYGVSLRFLFCLVMVFPSFLFGWTGMDGREDVRDIFHVHVHVHPAPRRQDSLHTWDIWRGKTSKRSEGGEPKRVQIVVTVHAAVAGHLQGSTLVWGHMWHCATGSFRLYVGACMQHHVARRIEINDAV